MTRKLLFLSLAALTLALLIPGAAQAGTTGKIHGFVKDEKGAPLPGANVVFEGIKQGAITDAKGYYVILNVPPGLYRLTASLIGYDKVTRSPVTAIADQTATVDFSLKETAVQMSEVVVTAERPLVEPDKTASKYVVTANEIERIGVVRSVQDLLQLLPGVSVDGSNRIRGSFVEGDPLGSSGYGTEVAYLVDGVRMNYNDARGRGGTFQAVNRGAIQEVSILTGVMPAEYGNTQAGVVNVVTKEGGNKYDGWVEMRFEPAGKKHWGANVYDSPQHLDRVRWSDPAWTNERNPATGRLVHQRTDYTRWSGYQAEGNASGPVGNRASFTVSVKHDAFAAPLPGPERRGFFDEQNRFVPSGPDNLTLSGSLTFKPAEGLKVKVGGLLQRWSYWNPGNEDLILIGTGGVIANLPGVMRGLGDSGRDLFLPEKWSAAGKQVMREELEYLVLTHTLSPKTFYEVRLSRSRSLNDTSGASLVTTLNQLDSDKWFNLGRQSAARWRRSDRQRYGVKVDLSSQVTESHFLKAGVEFIRGGMWLTQLIYSSPEARRIYLYADGLRLGRPVHPIFLNAYAQDKMEFRGMIVNLGLRMDAFNPNARIQQHNAYSGSPMFRTLTRARDYLYDDRSIWSIDAPWHIAFSPRIGVSHPITSKAQIRFSTGVFYQFADMYFFYSRDFYSAGKANDRDVNKNGRIDLTEDLNEMETSNQSGLNGTPLLRPAMSTSFEVGMDWNFISDYTAGLTTYYKSDVDQFTFYPNETWQGARDRNVIFTRSLDNGAWSDTRGIELSLRKAFKGNFSFQASYTLQWTRWTTGKLGNVIRNVLMDSNAVASLSKTGYTKTFPDGQQVFVPDFWIDFDPSPTGREIPRKMTEADIKKYGAQAQADIDNARKSGAKDTPLGTGVYDGVYPMAGEIGKKGVYTLTGGYSADTRQPRPGEHRSFGSLTLLLSLPDDFRLNPAFLGRLLSSLRATLINRIETGALTQYSSPLGGQPTWRELKMDSRTDLSVEKTFRPKGRLQPTFFVDVRNLFNQRDRTGPPAVTDYFFYGLEDPRPDDATYLKYGDINDRNYAHFPRRWNVGMRINW